MSNTVLNNEDRNIIQLQVVDFEIKRKTPKKTKSGEIKKTKSNKKMGVSSEVYPFYEDEIKKMIEVFDSKIEEAQLEKRPEYLNVKKERANKNKLLFLLGINLGIRASDIRLMKWNFFFNEHGKWRDFYTICPKKTANKHKFVKLFFNETVKKAVEEYIELYPIENYDDYIFTGFQLTNRLNTPITVQTIWNIITNTAEEANINKNVGTHSLRKTWGYHCWKNANDKNKALIILQQCFNHSSPQVTLRYIGLVDNDVKDMFMSVELGLLDD